MNTTLLIVYVTVALFMGLWWFVYLVKEFIRRKRIGGLVVKPLPDMPDLSPIIFPKSPNGTKYDELKLMTDEEWEHYWRNYY